MITGDLNTALVPWVVQYRITDPKMYLFGAREPEKTLRDLSESVMREVIGDRTVDEVLTIGRHDVETSTLKRLADLCSQYRSGNSDSTGSTHQRSSAVGCAGGVQ